MKRPDLCLLLLLVLGIIGSAAAWHRQASSAGAATSPWTRMERMPTARSEMPATVLGGRIYLAGGLGPFGRTLTAFEAFDPLEDRWTVLEPLPLPLHHAGAASMNGLVYVAGGYTSLDFRTDNAGAWVFDPASGSWSMIDEMPEPRAAHALVATAGRIFAIGGVGPRSDEVWAYDPSSGSWDTGLAPIPTPREHLTAVVYSGLIYVIGGRVSGRNLGTLEVYDPEADSWSAAPAMPTPRSGLSSAVVAGEIHVVGGEDLGGGGTFAVHEIFDPDRGEWRTGVPLPSPRHGLASAGVDGALYVIGGATRAGVETIVSLSDAVDALDVVEAR